MPRDRTSTRWTERGQPQHVLEFRARVAERIKEARHAAGFTIHELAVQLECSDSRIVNWEAARGLPQIHDIWRVCRALGLTPNALLNDE